MTTNEKTTGPSRFIQRPTGGSARRIRASFLSALLIAGAALFAPGGVQRASAQFPLNHLGTGVAADYQWDETMFSIGVFKIEVDPNFTNLFAPVFPNTAYYPGFSPSSGVLTSPVMYDSFTRIATSKRVSYSSPGFPLTVGNPAIFGAPAYNPANIIGGLGDYWGIPFPIAFPPMPPATVANPEEVFTEIMKFDLSCGVGMLDCGSNVQVPAPPATQITMVSAGPDSFPTAYSPGPNVVVTSQSYRSMGIVQQQFSTPGSAAQSFFNIYVGVNLPEVTGTFTSTAFTPAPPAFGYPFKMAQLYNDDQNPLVVVNTNVSKLPPEVVYIHGLTPAVPLKFRFSNPPYWNANDVFGYLTLAGHGVLTNCGGSPVGQEHTNCCSDAVAALALVDTVLGPVGSPKAGMPVPWTRPSNLFPTPGTSYGSIVNRMASGTTTNDLDATMNFQLGPGIVVKIRNLQIGGFSNSIPTPPALGTAAFSQTNIPVSFELSTSGGAWYPASGTGVVSMAISNTALASTTISYLTPPPQTNFQLRLTGFSSRSVANFGPFFLRRNPNGTNNSICLHTVRQTGAGTYTVASYIDADLQASTDGTQWFNGNTPLRLYPSRPPATPKPSTQPVIQIALNGTAVTLNWNGTYILQTTTNMPGCVNCWTDVGPAGTGPIILPITGAQQYFRLKQ